MIRMSNSVRSNYVLQRVLMNKYIATQAKFLSFFLSNSSLVKVNLNFIQKTKYS